MIVVFFGQPGSGKTELAKALISKGVAKDPIHIDGDEIREIFFDSNYTREGRIKNLNRASDIATFLNKTGRDVIISMVYPYNETRAHLRALNDVIRWVYVDYKGSRGREAFHVKDFDLPSLDEAIKIDTTNKTVSQSLDEILPFLFSFKFLAKSNIPSSHTSASFSMFVGRWQPWHSGHRWLIDQRLKLGKKVLLCIRNVVTDERNPWAASEIKNNIEKELSDLIAEGKLEIIIIPDIESINIGRDVGYDIIEHLPPYEVSQISATKIRQKLKGESKI